MKKTPKYNTKRNLSLFLDDFEIFVPIVNSSDEIPDNPGNYIVCLRKNSCLPDIGIDYEMKSFKVIYTGIAGKSLRKRNYKQHFTGNNAGTSTVRKSLGSLFRYSKIPRDRDPNTGKTKFTEQDELKLSDWMRSNLILFFKCNRYPGEQEDQLINAFILRLI